MKKVFMAVVGVTAYAAINRVVAEIDTRVRYKMSYREGTDAFYDQTNLADIDISRNKFRTAMEIGACFASLPILPAIAFCRVTRPRKQK